MHNIRENIIQNCVDGYNEFDIEKMVRDLDDEIVFQNIQNKEVNMILNGINAFKQQAEQVKSYFDNRQQIITCKKHIGDKTEIQYSAVLRIDFSNGMKKGQQLELQGESIFVFKENKISELTDIS